jgi:hypothetical protein
LPRNGVAGPPHFWPRGGRTGRMGVAEATPGLWGWSGHPKGQKKKKKHGKMCFGLWGWPDHPLGPGGGFRTPPTGRRGGFTPGPRRWSGHPKDFSVFFFFFFLAFRGGRTTPKGLRPVRPPLGQKWGGPATPFLGKGWLQPPRDSPYFFFFVFWKLQITSTTLIPLYQKTLRYPNLPDSLT